MLGFKKKDEPDTVLEGAAKDMFKPPTDVTDRVERSRKRIRQGAPMRDLCFRFFRDETYWYINDKGVLNVQATQTSVNGGGKPQHRVRTKRNMVTPLVDSKVSMATQRVPSYEINPSSFDPDRVSAASLAEKVALYGYDQWKVRRRFKKLVTTALVADEGFLLPFWDSNIGPFVPDGEGSYVGLGDVRILCLNRNQVGWEPGVEFDDSPWYHVDRAVPLEEAKRLDGFMGGSLVPDATTADTPTDNQKMQAENLVLLTEYFERPCPSYPQGRWLTMANARVIVGKSPGDAGKWQYRPYPLTNENDEPLDEPVLHRLSYRVDPDSDEDLGLVRYLIDGQRTYQDLWNKALEWKNRALNPRKQAPVGSMKTRPDDTPGGIDYYIPVGGQKPEWEVVPPVPESLRWLMEETRADMERIAAANEIPNQVEAGKAIQQFIESQQSQWASFVADLAEVHSRVMRHCLYLVAKHYTEPRLLKVRGRIGWESIDSFKGADLLGEVDVRVFPGSVAPLTRQQIMDWLNFLVQAFPGQVTMEQAMAALEQGTAEDMIKDYMLDLARANRIIQRIQAGPEVLFNTPERVDNGMTVPGWMPRPFDNIPVQKRAFENWMKTDTYDLLDPGIQEAANLYYDALRHLEMEQQLQGQMMQEQLAQDIGQQNATRPAAASPMPSLPKAGGTS